MDRFIENAEVATKAAKTNLKSNMDRFIAQHFKITAIIYKVFKIQYG